MIRKFVDRLFFIFASPETYAKHLGAKIGKGCMISTKGFSSESYLIEIGNNVRIASKTTFFTHGGVWSLRKIYNDPNLDHFGKIVVGDNSYIGENCMIMPGVKIGKNCIIGGGSVVTKSVPNGCMVAGNPAKFIGYTDDFYKRLSCAYRFECKGKSYQSKKNYLLSLSDDVFDQKKVIKMPEYNSYV